MIKNLVDVLCLYSMFKYTCPEHNQFTYTNDGDFKYCPICYIWLNFCDCGTLSCVKLHKIMGKNALVYLVAKELKG